MPDAPAAAPFAYRAFGLTILSDFELAELAPLTGPLRSGPFLTVRLGAVLDAWQQPDLDPFFSFGSGEDVLRWNAIGAFALRGEGEIVVEPAESIDRRLIAFPLLGPVLALCLHRRGQLVLHASAIEVDGAAVVLLGDKGAGKSTLAGALISAGHRLLSDDLLVVTPREDGTPWVEAAAGQLKLYPDSRSAVDLGTNEIVADEIHPAITKRQYRFCKDFVTDAAPLAALFAIEQGAEGPAICTLAPPEALQTLIRFSYPIRFGDDGLGSGGRQRLFAQCADLSMRRPVGRLTARAGLEHLGLTITAIENFVRDRQPGRDR